MGSRRVVRAIGAQVDSMSSSSLSGSWSNNQVSRQSVSQRMSDENEGIELTSKRWRVPPVLIELSITKPQELCEDVEPEMKQRIEHEEPGVEVGNGQLEDTLDNPREIHLLEGFY